MNKFIEFTERVEDKINRFFTWLNKDPENKKEAIFQVTIVAGMFISLLIAFSFIGN